MMNEDLIAALRGEMGDTLTAPLPNMEQVAAEVRGVVLSMPPEDIRAMMSMAYSCTRHEDRQIQTICFLAYCRLHDILAEAAHHLRDQDQEDAP